MSELLKLILIIVLGIVTIAGGLTFQLKNKKKDNVLINSNPSSSQASNLSENEKMAKQYIESYKSTYPKESIKQGLINQGMKEQEVNSYITKYL